MLSDFSTVPGLATGGLAVRLLAAPTGEVQIESVETTGGGMRMRFTFPVRLPPTEVFAPTFAATISLLAQETLSEGRIARLGLRIGTEALTLSGCRGEVLRQGPVRTGSARPVLLRFRRTTGDIHALFAPDRLRFPGHLAAECGTSVDCFFDFAVPGAETAPAASAGAAGGRAGSADRAPDIAFYDGLLRRFADLGGAGAAETAA